MKPKLFIGSSSESLNVAYAIQDNLNYDAEVTVWTQGVFKLSGNTLDDLIETVGNSHFAIFVFNPNDITIIRDKHESTVRDNVVFELGLFIGKLGKRNVFYVVPENEEVHLPTDLLGMNPGKYNSKRSDGNLHAALGSFTNQVRSELKKFVYINLKELDGESENAKKLVIDRPFAFEHLLLAELLETRLASINKKYNDLKKGLIFIRSKKVTGQDYLNFFLETLTDFKRFAQILESLYTCEIKVALGPDGVQAKYSDLKDISDKFLFLCNELIDWEMRNQQLDAPDELSLVKGLIKGWSEIFLSEINTVPGQIRGLVELYQDPNRDKTDVKITLKLEGIKNTEELMNS